ncbi:MAG: phosphatidate cytidylyltransferase [bacterium]
MLAKRIIVALIGIPLILFLIHIGGITFLLFVLIVMAMGLREFYSLIRKESLESLKVVGILSALYLGISTYMNVDTVGLGLFVSVLIIILFLTRVYTKNIETSVPDIAVTLLGVFYVGWLLSHLISLRQLPHFGREYTFLVFLTTWSIDNGAYVVGMTMGKHKAIPKISPKKSIEGIVGGLTGGIIAVLIAKWWFLPNLSYTHSIGIGLLLGVMGQLGDLAESLIKREANVKDTGSFLPGHGGILDRFDSIFFTAPVLYYYIKFLC